MMETPSARTCAVTGASGYVGGRIASHLASEGWRIVELGRRSDGGVRTFRLGEPVEPDALRGCDALVHCAYDFTPLTRDDVHAVNVRGAIRLFDAAREAGVRRIVLLSTISAFEGCQSIYGRAKLEIERAARAVGAIVIRPGLVYGPHAGGMFGRLAAQAKDARFAPIPAGGTTLQYLVHHDDLAAAVLAGIDRPAEPVEPVTVAHEQPWPLRDIMLEISRAADRRLRLVPVPWHLVWVGLRSAEFLRVPLAVRSDSLISLVHQNSAPVMNAREELGITCRPFSAASLEILPVR